MRNQNTRLGSALELLLAQVIATGCINNLPRNKPGDAKDRNFTVLYLSMGMRCGVVLSPHSKGSIVSVCAGKATSLQGMH